MTFKGYLKKGDYLIRVSSDETGRYQVAYSKDGFNTKEVKIYSSRYAFLKVMETRFLPEELKKVLS